MIFFKYIYEYTVYDKYWDIKLYSNASTHEKIRKGKKLKYKYWFLCLIALQRQSQRMLEHLGKYLSCSGKNCDFKAGLWDMNGRLNSGETEL